MVTAIAFWVMQASFKFHIAISEQLDKVIDFSYAMKSLGLHELDDQLAYIAKQKIPLYVSKIPITNTYLEDATVKRYTLLRDKEKIKYYKGDDRLCINAATYEQIIQTRAKEISSLESAAIAQKEEEIKSLAETLASTVTKFENLQKENAKLRNICKTQPVGSRVMYDLTDLEAMHLDLILKSDTILRRQGTSVNSKHAKTLKALFGTPPPRGMAWEDIESLLLAAGATMTEGNGSRVKFDLNGQTLAFHRPHNPKTARIYQISIAREFLESNGVRP